MAPTTATQQREGEPPLEPDSAEALLRLYAEERLDCAMGDAYTLAALNYNAFGRAELAVKYALLAVEAGSIEHGEHGHDVQDMKKLLSGPEKHWSWRRRVLG
uniref:HEPN domain-containing protein n=1 Tax=Magnaporthiopsis poae (strain ATCC 64411 / 73-15) TaxID=644358 RepID=A0A0C4E6U3_MAGP6